MNCNRCKCIIIETMDRFLAYQMHDNEIVCVDCVKVGEYIWDDLQVTSTGKEALHEAVKRFTERGYIDMPMMVPR